MKYLDLSPEQQKAYHMLDIYSQPEAAAELKEELFAAKLEEWKSQLGIPVEEVEVGELPFI